MATVTPWPVVRSSRPASSSHARSASTRSALTLWPTLSALWLAAGETTPAADVDHDTLAAVRALWLAAASCTLGGGIWAMHFIAMLAYEISLPMRFDLGLTVLSVVMAMVLSAAGFALSFSRVGGAVGGMVVGVAVLTMHYTGMAAAGFDAGTVCLSTGELKGHNLGVLVDLPGGHAAAAAESTGWGGEFKPIFMPQLSIPGGDSLLKSSALHSSAAPEHDAAAPPRGHRVEILSAA